MFQNCGDPLLPLIPLPVTTCLPLLWLRPLPSLPLCVQSSPACSSRALSGRCGKGSGMVMVGAGEEPLTLSGDLGLG